MRHYELVVVLSPMISPDEAGQAWERIKGFITNRAAEIVHEERWGTRRLAYPVRKGQYQFLEGNYHLTRFTTEQSFNRELENYLKLDDQVLRSLVTITLTEEELAAHAAQTRASRTPPAGTAVRVAGLAVNKIIVIGNLGRDPEMRYTPSGQAVTSFSVASSRRYRTADGEQREETEWFNVSAFGRLSEICNQYLTRGQQVYVEGRLRGRSYTDRDGQPRYSLEVTATEMQMLGRRGENEYGGGGGGGGGGYGDRESDGGGRGMADAGGPPPYDETDDLPF